MNIWIELATVAVELFLPWYFFSGMLGKSSSPRVLKILTGIIYGAALSALSLFVQSSPTRSAAIIILTFLAAKIYYRKSWLTTIYPTVLFFSITFSLSYFFKILFCNRPFYCPIAIVIFALFLYCKSLCPSSNNRSIFFVTVSSKHQQQHY